MSIGDASSEGGSLEGAAGWQLGFAALRRFVEVRGTADAGTRVIAGGTAVGAWVAEQRERYWSGQLTPQQVAALEALPGWRWDAKGLRNFAKGMSGLRRYAAINDVGVIPLSVTQGQFRLGVWVALQRAAHSSGGLTAEQIDALEQVPGWSWKELTRWDRGMTALTGYVAEYGTADVPSGTMFDGYPLGRWVERQRADHREQRLSDDHAHALQALPGWRWSLAQEAWRRGFAALEVWALDNGTAEPPQQLIVGGLRLGQWAADKRRQFRQGSLPREQQQALEALPGWSWSVQQAHWQRGFDALTGYLARHGHACPSIGDSQDGYPVGTWAYEQRRRHRRGRLPQPMSVALEALPGWTWDRALPTVED